MRRSPRRARRNASTSVRMQLAEHQLVDGPAAVLRESRRAGVARRLSRGIARTDRVEVGLQQGKNGRLCAVRIEAPDPAGPLTAPARLVAVEVVPAASRMRIDVAEGCRLALQGHEDARDQHVLEDIREIAGVKGVTVVHAGCLARLSRAVATVDPVRDDRDGRRQAIQRRTRALRPERHVRNVSPDRCAALATTTNGVAAARIRCPFSGRAGP